MAENDSNKSSLVRFNSSSQSSRVKMTSSRNDGSKSISRLKGKKDGISKEVSDASFDNSFQIQEESLSAGSSIPRQSNGIGSKVS